MDFSNNSAGTGVYTNSSSQQPYQTKMFSSVDYSPTRAAVAAAAMSMGPYRSFGEDMCYPSENGDDNGSSNRNQVKRLRYQPNGFDEAGEMKNSGRPIGQGYGEMMNGQEGFPSTGSGNSNERTGRENVNGGSHSTKNEKVPNEISKNPPVNSDSLVGRQMTFQELTTMHVEPMDFAVRDQSSQVRPVFSDIF